MVRCSITEKEETPLHVAAAAGHSTKFVRYLVDLMNDVDLELQNKDGYTAFCLAAISGNVDIAKIMAEKNQALQIIYASEKMMPLYNAAFHGNHDMVTYLYDQLMCDRTRSCHWTNVSKNEVLLKCIQAEIFGMQGLLIKYLSCVLVFVALS